MKLPKEEVELFYKLYPALLIYVNQRLGVLKNVTTPGQLLQTPPEKRVKIRDALYERTGFIDSFAKENPFNFSPEELEIILSWRYFVRGTFYVVQYLKNCAVFLSGGEHPKAYGVLALRDGFDELLPFIPVMVKTALLPFRGKIVYDGLVEVSNVIFGGGVRRSLMEELREAKHRFGMITTLPPQYEEEEKSDEEMLRFYMSSGSSRERYSDKIAELIDKTPELLKVYHREMGKSDARVLGRRLRGLGVKKGWFAVLNGNIIAGGRGREEIEKFLDEILPPEKRDFVYIFQLREGCLRKGRKNNTSG